MRTAIVVDGAYFLRRLRFRFPELDHGEPSDVAFALMFLSGCHLGAENPEEYLQKYRYKDTFYHSWSEWPDLYRIFFYDCPPLLKRTQRPVSKRPLDLANTDQARARLALHDELLALRKVALRLGRLNDRFGWRVRAEAASRWLKAGLPGTLSDDDFEIDTVQKGVDMRLGLDVASMAFKQQVQKIVIVAGDADFVPAAKLARREGIDVVLDPMGGTPAKDLIANVDGVRDQKFGQH